MAFNFGYYNLENIDQISFPERCQYKFETTKLIELLQRLKLIPHNVLHECGGTMTFIQRKKRMDGHCFYCPKCKRETSIRKNTFFENSKLSLFQIFCIIYFVCAKMDTHQNFIKEIKIKSSKTIVDWKHFVREVFLNYILKHKERIGGPGINVQIDESHLVKYKQFVGRIPIHHATWIVGGIDSNGNVFFEKTTVRDQQTLEDIIQRNVVEGSLIVTDGWPAYWGLTEMGFRHSVVIHKYEFVNSEGLHTNRIEATWNALKNSFRRVTNKKEDLIDSYISSYMFRKNEKNVFSKAIKAIHEIYTF